MLVYWLALRCVKKTNTVKTNMLSLFQAHPCASFEIDNDTPDLVCSLY